MNQDRSSGIGEGIRTGVGILTALKEALEETLDEAISRGDLTPERARAAMRDAADRVQASLGDARERLDLVSRKEYDALRLETEALRRRVEALEARSVRGAVAELTSGTDANDTPPSTGASSIPVD